jgi:hypothetical protein
LRSRSRGAALDVNIYITRASACEIVDDCLGALTHACRCRCRGTVVDRPPYHAPNFDWPWGQSKSLKLVARAGTRR